MVKESFSQDMPNKKEMTQQELENLLVVKGPFGVPETEFLRRIDNRESSTFVVDGNFNIFFSLKSHDNFFRESGINEKSCLMSNGSFQIDKKLRLYFSYRSFIEPDIKNIKKAVENKIGEYFKSKGLRIN